MSEDPSSPKGFAAAGRGQMTEVLEFGIGNAEVEKKMRLTSLSDSSL